MELPFWRPTLNQASISRMLEHFHTFKLEGLRLKMQQWKGQYPPLISPNVLQLMQQQLLTRLSRGIGIAVGIITLKK